MAAPLIGLTTYNDLETEQFMLYRNYVDSVQRAGGVPVLIPTREMDVASLLSSLDGIIFAGGGDIAPALYGGKSHETIYNLNAERDDFELALARQTLVTDIPVLAICRGIQLFNVLEGGTLVEHVPDEFGDEVPHRLMPGRGVSHHAVHLEPESRIAQLLGAVECTVASQHHQAIRQLADRFVVTGRASDGIIEAFEMPSHHWFVAVQWHPEMTTATDPIQQRLFDQFIQAAIASKK